MHGQISQAFVRQADMRDAEGVLKLCWQAHAERGERSPSGAKAESMIKDCIGGKGVIGLIEVGGDYRAMVGLVISSTWCSEDLELYDWLVFVRPDCRHLRYLSPLLAFAKEQSVTMGLPLWMGFIGDERTEAKARAYHRHFPKYGEFFRFDPRQH